jgi:WD40 repeat protein/tRNA A-37 threonylcarbamoyl transferase component Bud32
MLFGGYELLGEIGRGGMGVVYRARQLAINRVVALKMLLHGRFSEAAFVQRFRLEAEAAAHLDHPNIVPIYEVGQHEGQPYYSMKLIEGQNLDQANAECRMQNAEFKRSSADWLRQSVGLVATIAQAVHYAHERGVLHRDIKPHNILLDAEGQPHLTDFGLAKLLDQDSGLTASAAVIGSPGFMAPEQAAGKTKQVTTAADVYGLGAVLYVLLTGKPVFPADTPLETIRRVIEQEPVRPRLANPAVDRDLETICLKCLHKEPARRYASAQALAEDLECWLRAEPIQARRATQVEKIWLWCRRQPMRAGLTGALLLVFAVGLAGVLWQWRRAKAGELFARQTAYAAAMNLAQRHMVANEVRQSLNLLDKYRPIDKSEADLRDWEWRYLWQICRGDELSVLHRYASPISSVAVSRDGKLLAVSKGAGVPLWDWTTQKLVGELPDSVSKLAFCPTEPLLALATWNQAAQPVVKLWNTDSRTVTATLTNAAPLQSLAFSPDGKLLATLDARGNIRVTQWRSNRVVFAGETERPVLRIEAGRVAFSPDGRRLVIGADIGELLVLDCQSGRVVPIETGTADGVTALAVSGAGDLIAAGFAYTDGTIGLWDMGTGKARGRLTNHTAFVCALAFTRDGRHLVSGGMDCTIRVWDVGDLTECACLRTGGEEITALALLPDGKTLLSGGQNGAVCRWDWSALVRSREPARLVISLGWESTPGVSRSSYGPGPPDPKAIRRFGVAFSSDSRTFITSDPEGALAVCDARSMQVIERLPELGTNNWSVALSPDDHWLAVAHASGTIQVWDWPARRALASLVMPFQWVGRVWFSGKGQYLLAASASNEQLSTDIRIWETRHWTEIPAGRIHYASLVAADLSPDGRLLGVAYVDGRVQLSRFPSGQRLAEFKAPDGGLAVRFSPDGQFLALGCARGIVALWDLAHRRYFATWSGHFLSTFGLAFSDDGRRLLTTGRNPRDAVKLWDVATRKELLVLPAEGQIFFDAGFSPDGNTIFASSFGGIAQFWRAPSWAEIEAEEKRGEPLDRTGLQDRGKREENLRQ